MQRMHSLQQVRGKWNDEGWKLFQAHAQLHHNTPRAPEVENIKELPATELAEGSPKNQCPWCGLIQQAHRFTENSA